MAEVQKVVKAPALTPNALVQAEFARMVYAITLPEGSDFMQLLDPNYWVHVAVKFKPGFRIEVTTEDHAFFGELYVVACDRTWAKVVPLRYTPFRSEQKAKEPTKAASGLTLDEFNTEDHYVDYVQGQSKGRVVHRASKSVVREGFNSKKEAAEWMVAHEAELTKQSSLVD